VRITAIRGRNLASLHAFDIDLSSGPLADTRIFAITGPTGAGKSTLLDAMCLALYDRAPRLFRARDVPVGDVSAQDPRTVMRRGSSEAFAEVDFTGKDGEPYRAIWEVWRAHRRIDGRLQNQRMQLISLATGRNISGATKTETQEMIAGAVGLSFGEFSRAVLLAQGDFASFLEARGDERAELLERMTQTEIYAQLSRAAFHRRRTEEAALVELEAARGRIATLGEEDHAALAASLAAARARRAELEIALAEARAAVGFVVERRDLEAERDRAREAYDGARRRQAATAALRAEIGRAHEAEKLRAPFESARARRETAARARVEVEERRARRDEAARMAATSFEEATSCAKAERDLEEERSKLLPEIDAAQRIDVQIDDARTLTGEAERDVTERRQISRARDAELETILDQLEDRRAALATAEGWMGRNRGAAILAAQWPRWRSELERYRALAEKRAALADRSARAEHTHREASALLELLEARSTDLGAEKRAMDSAVDRAKEELRAFRLEVKRSDLDAAVAAIAREQASLDVMRTLLSEVQALARQASLLDAAAKTEARAAAAKSDDAGVARARRKELDAAHSASAASLSKLEVALDLASRRDTLLAEGEPCPLCGSTTHPARHQSSVESELIQRERSALERMEGERGRLDEEIRALEDALQQHERSAGAAGAQSSAIRASIEAKRGEWASKRDRMELAWLESPLLAKRRVNRVALELPPIPKAKGGRREVDRAQKALAAAGEELRALVVRDESLAEGLEKARSARDELSHRIAEIEPKLDTTRRAHADASARLDAIRRERAAIEEGCREAKSTLLQPLAIREGWERDLDRDPRAYIEVLDAEVRAFEANAVAIRDIEDRIAELEKAKDLSGAASERARRDGAKAEAVRAERIAKQSALERRRKAVLGGASVDAVREDLDARVRETEARTKDAERRHTLATEALAAAEERLDAAEETLGEAEALRLTGEAALDERLSGSSFPSVAELEASLARGPQWIDRELVHLAALDEEVRRLEVTLEDRTERLSKHLAAGDPGVDLAEAEQRVSALERELAGWVDEIARLAERAAADRRARDEAAALLPRIELQKGTLARWSDVSEVIGSADGKKLRTFAQGLTLDLLLARANLHLASLRPRYVLERVPTFDMELQVIDREMGDDVRSVATLSGGESFLVSLALALGLSSLSSRNVKVESLFIDEGFGYLDRESLDVALSLLDQLQAGGRTIGLISHVPEIAERIGYRVIVEPKGPGSSFVRVAAAC
jgi:exonuclease SbcC